VSSPAGELGGRGVGLSGVYHHDQLVRASIEGGGLRRALGYRIRVFSKVV